MMSQENVIFPVEDNPKDRALTLSGAKPLSRKRRIAKMVPRGGIEPPTP
jgi:hypothetical protein